MRVKSPRIVDVERAAVERVLERCRALLVSEDFEVLRGVVDTLARMEAIVRERGTSIARLRRLFGLSGSERSRDVLPPPPTVELVAAADSGSSVGPGDAGNAVPPTALAPPTASAVPPADGAETPPKEKRKGHGRIPALDYAAACHIPVGHATIRAGDSCGRCKGTIYRLRDPAPILRIVGHAPLVATCWDCERLRCATCGLVYTARAPEQAQGEKYDETASSMMALHL